MCGFSEIIFCNSSLYFLIFSQKKRPPSLFSTIAWAHQFHFYVDPMWRFKNRWYLFACSIFCFLPVHRGLPPPIDDQEKPRPRRPGLGASSEDSEEPPPAVEGDEDPDHGPRLGTATNTRENFVALTM